MEDQWKKVTSEKAADIISPDQLDSGSGALLATDMRPETFIHELCSAKKWNDAVKVMTRTLPPRESVWWACVCARQMESLAGNADEISALEMAEKWVYKPTDEHREAAFELVKESQAPSAGTLSAMAAAFSAGNLPLGEGQFSALDDDAFPQVVDAVVMIAAVEKEGEQINEQIQNFLKIGEDIACGGSGQIEAEEA